MPTNVTYGSCVEFTVAFFDAFQNLTVPTSGNLQIAYTSVNGSTVNVLIGLVPSGSFFTAIWDTTPAAYGLVNCSAFAPGAANNPAFTTQLRIIN